MADLANEGRRELQASLPWPTAAPRCRELGLVWPGAARPWPGSAIRVKGRVRERHLPAAVPVLVGRAAGQRERLGRATALSARQGRTKPG